MKKLLKDLSVEKCYEMYDKAVMNSDRQWKSSELLANDQDFGGAINKLITSVEELIKALIMLADAKGFEFRKADGMQSIILKSHSLRHLIGFIMFILNMFLDDLKKFIIKVKEKQYEIIEMYINNVSAERVTQEYMTKKIPIIIDEFKWFSRIEQIRQHASHVDLDDEIITPLCLTENDYNEVYDRLNNVRYFCNEFIESINSNDKSLKRQIKKFQKQFKDQGWYGNIAQAIKSTKNGKKNPFNLLGENFKDFDIEGLNNNDDKL